MPWPKGRKYSPEHIAKLTRSRTGLRRSEDSKRRYSESALVRWSNPEERRKASERTTRTLPGRGNFSKFYSRKCSCSFLCRSRLELKAMKLLESDDRVVSWEYEKVVSIYGDRRTITDLLVKMRGDVFVGVEVKSTWRLRRLFSRKDEKLLAAWVVHMALGYGFEIWTESSIRGPRESLLVG